MGILWHIACEPCLINTLVQMPLAAEALEKFQEEDTRVGIFLGLQSWGSVLRYFKATESQP